MPAVVTDVLELVAFLLIAAATGAAVTLFAPWCAGVATGGALLIPMSWLIERRYRRRV